MHFQGNFRTFSCCFVFSLFSAYTFMKLVPPTRRSQAHFIFKSYGNPSNIFLAFLMISWKRWNCSLKVMFWKIVLFCSFSLAWYSTHLFNVKWQSITASVRLEFIFLFETSKHNSVLKSLQFVNCYRTVKMEDSSDIDASNSSDLISQYIIEKFNTDNESIGHTYPECSINNCMLFAIFYYSVWKQCAQRRNASSENTSK